VKAGAVIANDCSANVASGNVYLTVYEFILDVDNVISPVEALILKPSGVAVKVPPASPVIVGVGSVPFVA